MNVSHTYSLHHLTPIGLSWKHLIIIMQPLQGIGIYVVSKGHKSSQPSWLYDLSSHDWKLIVNHPSLWHWESRFSYPEHVWMYYVNANRTSYVYRRMKNGLENIIVSGWGNNIPINFPLRVCTISTLMEIGQ